MAGNALVGIRLDDLIPPGETALYDDNGTSGMQEAAPYKIPPAAWMVIFLLVGYMGIRLILED